MRQTGVRLDGDSVTRIQEGRATASNEVIHDRHRWRDLVVELFGDGGAAIATPAAGPGQVAARTVTGGGG